MLPTIRFLWKSLNGPVVTALFTAIFRFVKSQVNAVLLYYRNSFWTWATMTNEHLTFWGNVAGFPRPRTNILEGWFFTEEQEFGIDYGFSESQWSAGGTFTEASQEAEVSLLPRTMYEAVLKGAASSGAQPGSLVYLDKIMEGLYRYVKNIDPTGKYNLNWTTLGQTMESGGAAGSADIEIVMRGGWTEGSLIKPVIYAISRTLYQPNCFLFPNFET